jgi:hypothetical protein
MRPRNFLRSLVVVVLAAACPSLTGCFSGWAYPSVSVVPPVAFAPVNEEVRAFRVDVKDDVFALDVGEHDHYELSEIKGAEQYLPQVKLALDHGWYMFGVALSFGQHTQYTVKVRLYRPGYQTGEINSWELGKTVEWKPAATVADQEAAIDALVSTWETTADFTQNWLISHHPDPAQRPDGPARFAFLSPGSTSEAHCEALRFAAGEYERVSGLAVQAGQAEIARRVGEKVAKLRELANQ